MKFLGLHTALVTPFDSQERLDFEGLRENIHFQIQEGVDGLVVLGTTGEAPTLSSKEQIEVVQTVVSETKKRVPIIVGTGCYSTANTIEKTALAEKLGADAALIVTPYYNKPTQEGLYQHFQAIAKAVSLPIIIYNIQGRTGQNMATSSLERLMAIPNIIGVKEASGSIHQIMDVIAAASIERPDFLVLSGDDALAFPLITLGGHGLISVASNLLPKQIKELVSASLQGKYDLARNCHFRLLPFFQAMFIETNPIPIKAAMNSCGLSAGPCRLPLCELQSENKNFLEKVIQECDAKSLYV